MLYLSNNADSLPGITNLFADQFSAVYINIVVHDPTDSEKTKN